MTVAFQRTFEILERWNNNEVTPSLSKPHELSYRSNISGRNEDQVPRENSFRFLIFIVKEIFNTYTREKSEESLKGIDVPRFEDICHFKGKSILKNKLKFINKVNLQERIQPNTISNHHIYTIRQQ